MASISFDPGGSAGTLTITPPFTPSRFNKWRPMPRYVGEGRAALGDGVFYQWVHRTDYKVSLELNCLSNQDEATLQEFLLWANAGGEFTVTTDDEESNVYTECQLAVDESGDIIPAELSDPDPETLDYTLSLTILNIAASPAPLRCIYA